MDIHVAGELKNLMILAGKNDWSCIFCGTSSACKGDFKKTIHILRKDELFMWGVKMQKIHFCSVHAAMRITEGLIKRFAVMVWRNSAGETAQGVQNTNMPVSASRNTNWAKVHKEHMEFALDLACRRTRKGLWLLHMQNGEQSQDQEGT